MDAWDGMVVLPQPGETFHSSWLSRRNHETSYPQKTDQHFRPTWRIQPCQISGQVPFEGHLKDWSRLGCNVGVVLMHSLESSRPYSGFYNRTLMDEVLNTMLIPIENLRHNWPLTQLSKYPSDPEPKTPNHLLLGRANSNILPDRFTDQDQSSYPLALANLFWRKWMREFIPTLTRRTKWQTPKLSLQSDDIAFFSSIQPPIVASKANHQNLCRTRRRRVFRLRQNRSYIAAPSHCETLLTLADHRLGCLRLTGHRAGDVMVIDNVNFMFNLVSLYILIAPVSLAIPGEIGRFPVDEVS